MSDLIGLAFLAILKIVYRFRQFAGRLLQVLAAIFRCICISGVGSLVSSPQPVVHGPEFLVNNAAPAVLEQVLLVQEPLVCLSCGAAGAEIQAFVLIKEPYHITSSLDESDPRIKFWFKSTHQLRERLLEMTVINLEERSSLRANYGCVLAVSIVE